ncbi:terminase [Aquabacterium sp.]|uniref:terminase n=1 Tax=Aquabacterium sp. TaxID=1872578 RepID=UPI0035B4B86E
MAGAVHDTPLAPLPKDAAELARCLADPEWRLFSGCLYKIIIKGEEGQDATVLPFKPNRAQRRFIKRLWHRNLILKARQLGFTTLIAILWLDHALWNANQRCGIIAQDREAAEAIFRDKVKFAYENLPEQIRERFPLARDSATELLFAHNNSSIRVATSMRSGTIHRLHISEFGKICAKFPDKAKEVVTGSIPAVPLSGVLVIESTAEGRDGAFFAMTQASQALHQQKKALTQRDYRFHFYPWWEAPEYRMDPDGVVITDKDAEHFDKIEAAMGTTLDDEQRAWYVATRQADFAGDPQKMWQEYPSTPDEAFQVSTEGTYYAVQLAQARKEGRITQVPYTPGVPVDTFWDIGLNDENCIWFHQKVGLRHAFIGYYANSGEPPAHYVAEMQRRGWVYGRHYLPHDGNTRRIQANGTKTYAELLTDLGLSNVEVVERIQSVTTGIQMVRNVFSNCWFDEKGCAEGLVGLQNYRKEWNSRLGVWSDYPRHDAASNPADAFRQFAQGYQEVYARGERPRSWRDRLGLRSNNNGSAQAA